MTICRRPSPDRDGKFKDPVGEGHRLDLGELFPVEFLIHRLPAGGAYRRTAFRLREGEANSRLAPF